MIKLDMPVIVEGKYDKITLENVIDSLIICTNGFSIFKDAEKCEMIRMFAEKSGVIVMTDSDSAGNMIRNHIKNITGNGNIINVYIPQIKGKEKRKTSPAKEGLLGLEGMTAEVIEKCLERSGVTFKKTDENKRKITKTDMFAAGLSGNENSSFKRRELLKKLDLPENLSANAMLDVINQILSYEEFIKITGGENL